MAVKDTYLKVTVLKEAFELGRVKNFSTEFSTRRHEVKAKH